MIWMSGSFCLLKDRRARSKKYGRSWVVTMTEIMHVVRPLRPRIAIERDAAQHGTAALRQSYDPETWIGTTRLFG